MTETEKEKLIRQYAAGEITWRTLRERLRRQLTGRTEPQPPEPDPDYAARCGWRVTMQVKEVGSGASRWEQREKLLEAACRREVDVVLVWQLDRWGR